MAGTVPSNLMSVQICHFDLLGTDLSAGEDVLPGSLPFLEGSNNLPFAPKGFEVASEAADLLAFLFGFASGAFSGATSGVT